MYRNGVRLIKLSNRYIIVFCLSILLGNVYGQRNSDLDSIFNKYIERGLPNFRNAEIDRELKEWLDNTQGTTGILASQYDRFRSSIETQRRSYKLPWFVGFIPAANTGFEPRFRSPSGFAGIWPLPYLIAKKYGLLLTALYDERREPEKATEAACKYLSELHNIYKNWPMTITAFRIGPARLNQVIHRVNTLNFDTIYLALEPQEQLPLIQFVAASISLSEFIEHHEEQITESQWSNRREVVSIDRALPFQFFNDHFNLSTLEMRNYNPALRTDLVPYMGKPFTFFLPPEEANRFEENRDSLIYWLEGRPEVIMEMDTVIQVFDGDTAMVINPKVEADTIGPKKDEKVWVYYRVKRGDALYTITDIFDCSIQDIRRWNNVPRKNFLISGKKLKFFVPSSKKVYYQSINTMSLSQKRSRARKDD